MYLTMAGIDFHTAPAELREHFAFTEADTSEFLNRIYASDGVEGCAAIVTCNRTELYISVSDGAEISGGTALLSFSGMDSAGDSIYCYDNQDAVSHLIEVACGLHSQIIHEEQIVTQVNRSIALSRKLKTSDAVLDTLFRIAVSAGKYSLSNVAQTGIPLSLSYEAVRRLENEEGCLKNKKCVIIGNGKMGRLAAELLVRRGCEVYVTLRTYRHGENIVPYGTFPIRYDERIKYINGADIVISATRSPHHTITYDMMNSIEKKPRWLIDLAMPCDIEKKCSNIPDIRFRNLDDFNAGSQADESLICELKEISEKYAGDFWEWVNYREAIPYIEKLKRVMPECVLKSTAMDEYREAERSEEIVYITARKIIDMLMGSLKSNINPELLESCCDKIAGRAHITENEM